MRIDKLLWFLRFVKSRSLAQTLVGEGHIRHNGRRVERCSHNVAAGDVLVLPLAQGVQVIELLAMPNRRGPGDEARACYRLIEQHDASPRSDT